MSTEQEILVARRDDVEPLAAPPPEELRRAQAARLLKAWETPMTGLRGMPRRVFTYPAGLGLDTLNLVSTIGAFILALGIAIVFWDLIRPKKKEPY